MRRGGERNTGSGSRCSRGRPTEPERGADSRTRGQPDTRTAGHRHSRTHGQTAGHTDGQSAAPPQGPHAVTNLPPPAQPISEQPARRRPIRAPFRDCLGGTANGRAALVLLPLGRPGAAGPGWLRAPGGRCGSDRGLSAEPLSAELSPAEPRPAEPPLAAAAVRAPCAASWNSATQPFASGLRDTKEAGLVHRGARDWLESPERVGGVRELLLPIGWVPCPSRSAARPLGGGAAVPWRRRRAGEDVGRRREEAGALPQRAAHGARAPRRPQPLRPGRAALGARQGVPKMYAV
ncbi:zinc finger FYVE domain-containing protein 21 isoform X1 [Zonotrichia albicollis]|uniref:zinc finger FYVE domain-containing protein 21 isoform X1 n=1 Tax=Zonotrichia albicollis TaxID=44394 RepID=UPI003D8107A5